VAQKSIDLKSLDPREDRDVKKLEARIGALEAQLPQLREHADRAEAEHARLGEQAELASALAEAGREPPGDPPALAREARRLRNAAIVVRHDAAQCEQELDRARVELAAAQKRARERCQERIDKARRDELAGLGAALLDAAGAYGRLRELRRLARETGLQAPGPAEPWDELLAPSGGVQNGLAETKLSRLLRDLAEAGIDAPLRRAQREYEPIRGSIEALAYEESTLGRLALDPGPNAPPPVAPIEPRPLVSKPAGRRF